MLWPSTRVRELGDEGARSREDGVGGARVDGEVLGAVVLGTADHDVARARHDIRGDAEVERGIVDPPPVHAHLLQVDDLPAHGLHAGVADELARAEAGRVDDGAVQLGEDRTSRCSTVPPSSRTRPASHGR